MGALYHPPGGIIRHDAVVWGLARGADRGGAEIHPYNEVAGIERSNGSATGVTLADGRRINAGHVVSATAGWSSTITEMAGVQLPITTHILQAMVTEPLKPLLDIVIVSSQMHVYISQTDRGEFLIGAEIEPWTTYRQQGTLNFIQEASRHALELFPSSSAPASCAAGPASATSAPTSARSSATPRSRTSRSAPAGAPTASRPRRSSARRWPSWSPPARPRS